MVSMKAFAILGCLALVFAGHCSADGLQSPGAAEAGTGLQRSAIPREWIASDYVEATTADEPYLIRCSPSASRIVVFLHTWSNDYRTVRQVFPELVSLERACVVAPNFSGPNNTPQALGSDDTIRRIDAVIRDVKQRTGLSRVDLSAVSGGTMAALNYMGKHPGRIHSASLWLVIYDLASLYNATQDQPLKDDMLKVLGRPPTGPNDPAYLARSPRARLAHIKGSTKITMNVGDKDTTSPPNQADMAKARIKAVSPDLPVVIKSWPIAHEFAAPARQEALKQLAVE